MQKKIKGKKKCQCNLATAFYATVFHTQVPPVHGNSALTVVPQTRVQAFLGRFSCPRVMRFDLKILFDMTCTEIECREADVCACVCERFLVIL